MQANQQLANEKAGCVAINAKWLDFSCFVMDGNVLEAGHAKIEQCFAQLTKHSQPELHLVIEYVVCISKCQGHLI